MKLWKFLKDAFASYVAPSHAEVVEAKLNTIADRIMSKGYAGDARHNVVTDVVTIKIVMSAECCANLEGKADQAFWDRVDRYLEALTDRTRS